MGTYDTIRIQWASNPCDTWDLYFYLLFEFDDLVNESMISDERGS